MRLMSFAATTEQMREGTKTVTRRLDAKGFYARVLTPGTLVLACAKTRGVRKEDRDDLGVIEIVDVRREPLFRLEVSNVECCKCEGYGATDQDGGCTVCNYGGWQNTECILEGFPTMDSTEFIDLFCRINRCEREVNVTRIEFRHRPDLTTCCGVKRVVSDDGTTHFYVCSKCGEGT